MKEAFDRVSTIFTNVNVVSGDILPIGFENREPIPISEKHFRQLPEPTEAPVLFVDGGEGILLDSSTHLVCIVRLAGVCYSKKRLWHERCSYLLCISFDADSNSYKTSTIALEESSFTPPEISPTDIHNSQFVEKGKRVYPRHVLSVARKCHEYAFAMSLLDKDVSLVLLDGTFDAATQIEREAIHDLQDKCLQNNILLGGLAKTTNILTSISMPLPFVLLQREPMDKWWYPAICKLSKNGIQNSMVKLSSRGKFCFRLDAREKDLEKIISHLQLSSNDPVFSGYPYGLIEADSLARVSKSDVEQSRLRLNASLSKSGIDISLLETSNSAHGVLDKIKF